MSNDYEDAKAKLIAEITSRAKIKDGGRTSCPDNRWSISAKASVGAILSLYPPPNFPHLEDHQVASIADSVLSSIRESYESLTNIIVPAVSSCSASTMNDNNSHKRKYERDILKKQDCYGSFVSVKSYTQFCLKMTSSYTLKNRTTEIMKEPIHTLFPREEDRPTALEKPRSAQLARLLQSELADMDSVEVVHQLPIVPRTKVNDQDVDVGFIVDRGIAAVLEYKPALQFDGFITQASVYGTDTMAAFNRPCLVVQARGEYMHSLEIRVYGIVVNFYQPPPTHARSLLLSAHGEDGLKMFISGLKAYLQSYRNEPVDWHQGYLSNVVSLQKEGSTAPDDEGALVVYKAYDYRLRTSLVPREDRRHHNINLVREFIDSEAKLTSNGDDFHIVATKFLKRSDGKAWYDAVNSKQLAKIVNCLKRLHEKSYVHGDIRLRNMVLHEGILTDFDYARPLDSKYPSTLLAIEGDGVRHPDVVAAIKEQPDFESGQQRIGSPPLRIGQLPMTFDHDIYAMKYVLGNFRPLNTSRQAEWAKIVQVDDLWSMPVFLDEFNDLVEFTGNMDRREGDRPSTGTGSPIKRP
jgi:hypothetical protein